MVKRIAKAQVDTKPAVKVDRVKKSAAQKTADPSDLEAPIGESNQWQRPAIDRMYMSRSSAC